MRAKSRAPGWDRSAVLPALRRPLALVAAIGAVGLLLLAVRYAETATAGRFDARADAHIEHLMGTVVDHAVVLGGPTIVVVSAGFLAAVCAVRGRWRLAVVAVAGPGLTGVATTTLKPVVGRVFAGEFSLPSGHTAGATAVAVVVALLAVAVAGSRAAVVAAAIAGVVLAGAGIGLASVADGGHYATDTVAGFCTAVAVVGAVALAVDAVAERLLHRSGQDPAGRSE